MCASCAGAHATCKVHNSIAVYAAMVSFLTILCTTEALQASVGGLLDIVLANDYVNHLYFCYLPTSVITAIDQTST